MKLGKKYKLDLTLTGVDMKTDITDKNLLAIYRKNVNNMHDMEFLKPLDTKTEEDLDYFMIILKLYFEEDDKPSELVFNGLCS